MKRIQNNRPNLLLLRIEESNAVVPFGSLTGVLGKVDLALHAYRVGERFLENAEYSEADLRGKAGER